MSDCPPVDSTSSAQQVLKNVLTKPAEDSKKYRVTILGIQLLSGGFIVGAALCFVQPSLAGSITTFTQIFMTAVGGLISVYLGGQSASEWKASSALSATNVQESKTSDETRTHTLRLEMDADSDLPRDQVNDDQ